MKVLVIGAAGMLGHQIVRKLTDDFTVFTTVRGSRERYRQAGIALPEDTFHGVNALCDDHVDSVLRACTPDVVINCVGLVKQRKDAASPIPSIEINALLPHKLNAMCQQAGARFIHFSTDCVFSGRTGMYPDHAPHDASDMYGRSKSLGEVDGPGSLTLRTSLIGPELENKLGLVEWFLAQRGAIRGFTRVVFSGLTTFATCRVVADLLQRHPNAEGVYNLAAAPISKHDLLCMLRDALGLPVEITPTDEPDCNRSLDGSRFREHFGWTPPTWPEMVDELARELHARGTTASRCPCQPTPQHPQPAHKEYPCISKIRLFS
ncbi:dTDP-4-dehydrorhamnose reductase family protein [Nitratidesulfovibrio vulgaris]|uniref:dTDP-4-dehydrorhamnose reductase family protein n=1 Tax=Nitratidesulfovibrio vulgaris TaxID=881 RepID=UPI002300DBE6|nr:SDR family oxidoreductase [Nitratidesulfovibrio vulgaris]WCB46372.1 SDR family oxidoreductase [Nitratidesulfovibrio vulgaris]